MFQSAVLSPLLDAFQSLILFMLSIVLNISESWRDDCNIPSFSFTLSSMFVQCHSPYSPVMLFTFHRNSQRTLSGNILA